jgi:hypothetical protein
MDISYLLSPTRSYQTYLAENYYWEELIKDLPEPLTLDLLEDRLKTICREHSIYSYYFDMIDFCEIARIFL